MILVWRGFYLSLAIHLIVFAILVLLPKPPEREEISFDFIPTTKVLPSKLIQTIVRDQLLPDSLRKDQSQDPWRFLSEKNQFVKEQTRALKYGLTKNRSNKPSMNSGKDVHAKKIDDFLPSKILIPTAKQFQAKGDPGLSTISADLPVDVKIGDITSLNTERYLFYSYFARSEEQLRHEWEPMVHKVLEYPPIDMQVSIHNKFTSLVEAWFYPNGKLHSIHLLKSSGVQELDHAATQSFRQIGMMPNPPKERIEKDGLVRFQWSLTVPYNPKVLVRE